MIEESEYFSNVIETEFDKPLVMNKKDHANLKNCIKC